MKSVFNIFAAFLVIFFSVNTLAEEFAPQSIKGAETIDVAQAKKLHSEGVLFVDVRPAVDFDAGHIPGAKNLPIPKGFNKRAFKELATKDTTVVFYCYGVECQRSSLATKKAVLWGFKDIKYFRRGMPAWDEAGHDTAKM